jgi:hypothetical protein
VVADAGAAAISIAVPPAINNDPIRRLIRAPSLGIPLPREYAVRSANHKCNDGYTVKNAAIDDIDREILGELVGNARFSYSELGKRVSPSSRSPASCARDRGLARIDLGHLPLHGARE